MFSTNIMRVLPFHNTSSILESKVYTNIVFWPITSVRRGEPKRI
jgi:hypothetical protein